MYTLFITRGYPTAQYKTNGIFEFDQAKALAEQGCKVVYAAVDLRSIRRWRKWGIKREYVDGVDVYAINIPLGKIPKRILRVFSYIGLKVLYRRIVKEIGVPDVLHGHFTGSGYTASKLKDKTNIPLIITEHSSQINKNDINKELFQIAKIAYDKADSVIAVSPALRDRIYAEFNIDSNYIPNMVDLEVFKYGEKIGKDSFNFVSTGNLIDLKRMDLTIRAFYKAFGNNPNITLTIFGQGPKRSMLENLIEKYSLDSQVKLMGLCSREKIRNQLIKSDCFVLASQSETFGVAYIEALAMGVPVIATKCGGPEEFINERNGIMIQVNNEEELIKSMTYMFNNIEKYNRESISEETKHKFSSEIITDKIIEEYKKVLYS